MPKSLAEYLSEVRRAVPAADQRESPLPGSTAPITDTVDLSDYRPILPEEKDLIAALLHHSGSEAEAFLPQLEGMLVTPGCTCGCPSLTFAPPPESQRIEYSRRNIVADLIGEAADGTVGILLYQAGGKLNSLEIYDLAGREDGKPYALPTPKTLQGFHSSP